MKLTNILIQQGRRRIHRITKAQRKVIDSEASRFDFRRKIREEHENNSHGKKKLNVNVQNVKKDDFDKNEKNEKSKQEIMRKVNLALEKKGLKIVDKGYDDGNNSFEIIDI